jgi:hypothetical protein
MPMVASGAPRKTGREAVMASSVELVLILTAVAFGVLIGGFLMVSFAIRRDDSDLGSIRYDAPNQRARTARHLVGISASRWE